MLTRTQKERYQNLISNRRFPQISIFDVYDKPSDKKIDAWIKARDEFYIDHIDAYKYFFGVIGYNCMSFTLGAKRKEADKILYTVWTKDNKYEWEEI